MKGSLQNQGAAAQDKRGKSTTSRVSIEARERVKTHIESFPNEPSHYSRRSNPDVRYLSGDLNIRKMYELYVVMLPSDRDDIVPERHMHMDVLEFSCSVSTAFLIIQIQLFLIMFYSPKPAL